MGKPSAGGDCPEAVIAYIRGLARLVEVHGIQRFQTPHDRWQRGPDGAVRHTSGDVQAVVSYPSPQAAAALEGYTLAKQAIQEDRDFGPLIGRLVGTRSQDAHVTDQIDELRRVRPVRSP